MLKDKKLYKLYLPKLVYLVFLIVIVFYLYNVYIDNRQGLGNVDIDFSLLPFVASVLLVWAGYFLLAYSWLKLTINIGGVFTGSFVNLLRIYTLSMISKYIPGKVWIVASKVYLGEQLGFSKSVLLISSVLDALFSLGAMFMIGVLFVSGEFFSGYLYLFVVIFTIAGVLILLHPAAISKLSFLSKLISKDFGNSIKKVDLKSSYSVFIFYLLSAYLRALAFYFFVTSIIAVKSDDMAMIIGAYAIATTLGVIAFFAPSGIGVKEGVLATLLKSIMLGSNAVLVSLWARIWHLFCEVSLFIFSYLLSLVKVTIKSKKL